MRRSQLPHYGLLSALALLGLCAADVLRSEAVLSLRSWLLLLLLASVVGALNGGAWRIALRIVGRRTWRTQIWITGAIGFAIAATLAHRLGAFERLDGPYRKLAAMVLAACTGGAIGFIGFALLLLPGIATPEGRVRAYSARVRWPMCVLLTAAALASFHYEPRYLPGAYPDAHTALRCTSLWSLMAALALTSLGTHLARSERRLRIAFLACALTLPILGSVWPRSIDELLLGNWPIQLVRAARSALDFDRDGYASLLGGGDCNDWNPRIHPGAREIPGNGIDDNCLLGDAKPAPELPAPPMTATAPSPVDVVLIVVDSLRPDHVGFFDASSGKAGRNVTPNIDAWAAQFAVAFEHVYATGGWTSISVASLMRGLYPRRLSWTRYYELLSHRLVREDERASSGEQVLQMFPLAWNDPHPTLAGLLKRRGMRTAAIVHDGFSQMLTHGIGVERDFDAYREVEAEPSLEQSDAGSVALMEQELARAPKGQGLFMWVHFFGVHSVNEYHPGIPVYGPQQSDAYDHEIRYFDSLWPRLWRAIRRRGDNVVTILTSDHGEVFTEFNRMHGFSASEGDIRVPLFIHVPGVAPKRVRQLASTIDLFPTLLALTRTPAPRGIDGIDLQPWIAGNARERPRFLIAETWRYTQDGQPIVDYIAALDGSRKLLLNAVDQSYRAFDVLHEPEAPIASDTAPSEALRGVLDAYVEATGGALNPER